MEHLTRGDFRANVVRVGACLTKNDKCMNETSGWNG